jgi:S1-C subfamily serine protease
MKLYTRTHVAILGIVVSLVMLAAGVLATALLIVPDAVQRQLSAQPGRGGPEMNVTPVQFTGNLAPSLKPGDLTDDELNSIQIYERANRAVVYVTTVTTQYTWFYQAVQQEGTGSGVIIDQLGHVITNYHVINGADKISIALADGSIEEAKIVGTDPENDLAVLQFNPKGKTLTTVTFGDSSVLRVGMKVLAIGNPFGLDRTSADRAGVHDQGNDPDRRRDQPGQFRRRPAELPQRADRNQHRDQVPVRRLGRRGIRNPFGHREEDRR